MENKNLMSFSLAAIQRMPNYLRYLKELQQSGIIYASSTIIGNKMNLNPILVKKDLSIVTSIEGKPRLGYKISTLINDIESFLGYNNLKDAVIIGCGNLGRALLSYPGFSNYGVNICLGFDTDSEIIGSVINGITIMPLSKLEDLIDRLHIHIAILTVPKEAAQEIANRLEKTQIRAIWNWAPTQLNVSQHIAVKNEDIASSLAILTNKMKEIIEKE